MSIATPAFAAAQQPGDDGISVVPLALIAPTQDPFGRIADLELYSDGLVYVLDAFNRNIRVFDLQGAELRRFGQRGRGPGELEQPTQLLWGPSGHLWVLDLGNRRLSVFSRAGEVIATHRLPASQIVFPFALGFAGEDVLRWVGVSSPDPANPTAAWVETLVSPTGLTAGDSKDLPFVQWPQLFEHRTADLSLVLPVPFTGEPKFAFDPSGQLWYAFTRQPTVQRWSGEGGLDFEVGGDAPAPRLTTDERRDVLESRELEEIRAAGTAVINRMDEAIPQTRPPIDGFFLDDLGLIWIVRAGTGSGPRTVEVFDQDGTSHGEVRIALSADPRPRIRGGVLAAVVRDEFEIESVVLYQVRR